MAEKRKSATKPAASRQRRAPVAKTVAGQVGALIDSVRREMRVPDTAFEARAALALALARQVDAPGEQSVAPVAKELRSLIGELASEVDRDDDSDAFGSDLPASVRH